MDSRVELIQAFYRGLPSDRVKLETQRHGFSYLAELLAQGAVLDYGELTLSGTLHKYKLSGMAKGQLAQLLQEHVEQTCNVCLYFGAEENSLCCFNLDNNFKENNTAVIPEMHAARQLLQRLLAEVGCAPLVVASGRGYHFWLRLEAAVANARLYQLMLGAAVKVAAGLAGQGLDHRRVKFNFYPDPRTENTVSLRLFGSLHAKNRVFSQVVNADGTLCDEATSWARFEQYLHENLVTVPVFAQAEAALAPKS